MICIKDGFLGRCFISHTSCFRLGKPIAVVSAPVSGTKDSPINVYFFSCTIQVKSTVDDDSQGVAFLWTFTVGVFADALLLFLLLLPGIEADAIGMT